MGNLDKKKECIALAYLKAKRDVLKCGFEDEIEWQYNIDFNSINEKTFLEEYAWVVLCSGMKEKIIRKVFPEFSEDFYYWESSKIIYTNKDICSHKALKIFHNKMKIDAIINTAQKIYYSGFLQVKQEILSNGTLYLTEFPFIGPATSLHLAKNIGFSVAKPDRHLLRIAKGLGYASPQDLCFEIRNMTDDPIQVIDIVLWRYSTLKNDFIDLCKMA